MALTQTSFVDPHWYQCKSDPDPGSLTNEDPDPNPGQTLKEQKVEFLHEKKY
jgi:hypothetical protein